MAPVTTALTVLGLLYCASFIMCLSLLSIRLVIRCKKKKQIANANQRAIRLSLVCMSLFTFSLFLYALQFILCVVHDHVIQLDFLNNFCYLAAIFTASYVWIQRLEDTFHNSVHGYSAKYIQNLRIFCFVTLMWGLCTGIQHFMVISLGLLHLRVYIAVCGILFVLMFISLFVTVLYSFIRKMKQALTLTVRVPRGHRSHSIGNELLQLIVKYTILSVLCIGSTLCMLAFSIVFVAIGFPIINWHWIHFPLAIDDCIGFITLYCAWGNNKEYRTLFGCVHSMIIKHTDEPPPPDPDMTDGDTICTAPGLSAVQSSGLVPPNTV
eukprot:217120_1